MHRGCAQERKETIGRLESERNSLAARADELEAIGREKSVRIDELQEAVNQLTRSLEQNAGATRTTVDELREHVRILHEESEAREKAHQETLASAYASATKGAESKLLRMAEETRNKVPQLHATPLH